MAAKSGPGVETAHIAVGIVWETKTIRHFANLVPGVGFGRHCKSGPEREARKTIAAGSTIAGTRNTMQRDLEGTLLRRGRGGISVIVLFPSRINPLYSKTCSVRRKTTVLSN